MALSPWPERSTMPVAWPAAVRQLAASLNQSVPATGSLVDDATLIRLDQLASMVSARAEKEAPGAPQEARDEAIVRAVGYLLQAGTGRSGRRGSRVWRLSIRRAISAGGTIAGPLLFSLPGTLRVGESRMKFPWRFWEKREGYTDTIINALIQAAEGSARNAHATAALESAAGLYQAAFSAAKVEPEQEALGPSFLGEAARRLIRYGQAVYLIEIEDGKIRLRDVGSWNIGGGPNEEDWTYECEMAGPTKSETIRRPSSGVIHFRYAVDPLRPWEGLDPFKAHPPPGHSWEHLSSVWARSPRLLARFLLPIPADGGDGGEGDPLAKLKADIAKAKGRPITVKTTAGGFGEGPGSAPQRDWQQSRIGANPPDVLVNLRTETTLSVMSACQVPISLITDADGTSQREAWRRFVMGAVEPLSQRMGEELSRKLDLPSLDFKFRSLWASDLIGRTQAFQRLVQGGMGIQEAVSAAGIMAE